MTPATLRWTTLLAISALLGCASSPPSPSPAAEVAAARRSERMEEAQRLEAERFALRREMAGECVERLRRSDDPEERRRLAARALRLAPGLLTDLRPEEMAAVAPDILRVYDLGAVLDAGLDRPVALRLPGGAWDWWGKAGTSPGGPRAPGRGVPLADLAGEARASRDGGELLLERIARHVREEAGGEVSAVLAVGEHLAVLGSPDCFAAVERSLDRHAVVGGSVLSVRATRVRGVTGPAGKLTWLEEGAKLPRTVGRALVLDVPFGRERGALRGARRSYLADYDVRSEVAAADPEVRQLVEGLCVDVVWGASDPDGTPRARILVAESKVAAPIADFSTTIAGAVPVRIQLPEVEVASARGAGEVSGERAALAGLSGGRSVLLELAVRDGAGPPRPAWRRLPSEAPPAPAPDERLVANALDLARVQLDLHRPAGAARVLSEAVRDGPEGVWTRHARFHPELGEVVLLRRPVAEPEAEVMAALDRFRVGPADPGGFVEVRDGVLVACLPASAAGSVDRALGSLLRSHAAGATVRITPLEPAGDPAAAEAAAAERISFVRDFDLEVEGDAFIADPVIGVLTDGAVLSARPVPGEPGVVDVTIRHAVVERRIPTFETGVGGGAPVTIQLPRQLVHETTRRVRLGGRKAVEIATTVDLALGKDTRRFRIESVPRR